MATPRPRRRLLALTTLVALLALVAAACGSDDSNGAGDGATSSTTADQGGGDDGPELPDKIRIGYQHIPNGDLIVKSEGWLEEAFGDDVDIEWILFDSGGAVNEAFLAGALDIGLAGSSPVARGLSNGIDYQVPWIHNVIGEAEALVVREGITSLEDLVGKRVATPFASTTHYSLLSALEDAGIDPTSVDIIDAQPPEILAAWERGDIDGTYVWNPTLAEILGGGGAEVLVTSADLAAEGKVTYDLAVVSTSFAADHPDAVELWVEAQDRAVELILSDPEAAAEIVAVELNIEPAEALDQFGGLVYVRAADQVGPDHFGGVLGDNLFATAAFNQELGEIQSVLDEQAYQDAIYTAAAEAVAAG